ncbi:response regulator transcription factor [Anaerocolumna sp. MB42-C2]|uniref:response regulator transcription factor n=1 Tax=Anaerocolumna sp. MB42-C2 TaxID=3070997 RepID=UPI0027DF8E47|nr:response regulator transcription factor [Anaerocolumna sp. MB42-C2]WMJ89942.1 response regulator transcription factor [Anaerocolumna sp. MB42-C2]
MKLLMIEDDEELCEAVAVHIKKEGYEFDKCYTGDEAAYYLDGSAYDVIILDRMLPGVDGLSILEDIRNRGNTTPVIMVTAMNGINDRIDGLDGGADDYLVKPFEVQELMARIRALLRRPRKMEDLTVLKYMNVELNTNTYTAACDGKNVSLSKREGALLEFFLLNKEQILTREQILGRVWGMDSFVEDGNIDNYIFFIRRRLKALDAKVNIKTIHGIGYRMEKNENA